MGVMNNMLLQLRLYNLVVAKGMNINYFAGRTFWCYASCNVTIRT